MSLAATEPPQPGLGQTAPVPISTKSLSSAQRRGSGDETPRASASAADNTDEVVDGKKKKRSLFGFGKKKTADEGNQTFKSRSDRTTSSTTPRSNPASAPSSGPPTRRTTASSPINIEATNTMLTTSPGGRTFSSSSPRVVSPSGSQIFERDVTVLIPNSPAIPNHIQTENYIPPVLDASSEAITDNHLDPDSVEIITHTSHQPAASGLNFQEPQTATWQDELASSFARRDLGLGVSHGNADSASNYGNLESSVDVRRLSFISFADVVQAEQGPGATGNSQRDSVHLGGLTSIPSAGFAAGNRSPSPIRSPISSSAGGASPSPSKSGSFKGLEMGPGLSPGLSPARKPLGSPTSLQHHIPALGGELNVETMTQALRRTGSGDLGLHRSQPTSPVEGPGR